MKKQALGQGISSLLPNKIVNQQNKFEINISNISPNIHQPRKIFKENELYELSESIKNHGILQPIIVRKSDSNTYTIIAGERRWRAAKIAGLISIPVVIKDIDKKSEKEIALIENIQRENLNPIEEAEIYDSLLKNYDYTHESLATKIGKSRSYISNYIRLLQLPEKIKKLVINNKISAGHAKLLISSKNPEKLADLVQKSNLSVRDLEKHLKKAPEYSKAYNSSDADVNMLQNKISKKLNLQSKIKMSKNGGKIEIYFKTMDDFDCLVNLLCKPDNNFNL